MDPQHGDSEGQDVHNTSSGSTDSNPPSGQPHKKLGASTFLTLLGKKDESFYIDKTGLVEAFLNCSRQQVLLTAPRRFGKTINISMLQSFFELQIPAEECKTLSQEDFQSKIKETNNYKLFQEHELVITKQSHLMEKYFGKYPVIHISFKHEHSIGSYDEAVLLCSRSIRKAFAKHKYLESSTALDPWERSHFTKWCSGEWDPTNLNDSVNILHGLKTLVDYMYKHFDKKVVLLVDEYDSIITQALLGLKTAEELQRVINFCCGVIKSAVKEDSNEAFIEYAFITGISHISGMGLSGSNIRPFRFLDEHRFVPFYGLTEAETRQLLQTTYKWNEEQIADAKELCNGYSSKGSKHNMYNTWSLLDYVINIKEGDGLDTWQDTGYVVGLEEAFRVPAIREEIETKLLLNEPIELQKVGCFRVHDLMKLVQIIGKVEPKNVDSPSPGLFFSFILDQGYLSYVPRSRKVLIPNLQLKEEFQKKIVEYHIFEKHIDAQHLDKCRQFLEKISESTCTKEDVEKFHMNLEMLLKQYAESWNQINEANILIAIGNITNDLGFKVCAQQTFSYKYNGKVEKKVIDFLIIKDSFVMIIVGKFNQTHKQGMECIRDRQYCKVFEARDVIRIPVKRFVLLVVAMDVNKNVSIGCLQDSQDINAGIYIPVL